MITLRKIFKSGCRSRSHTEHSIMSTTSRQQLNQETSVLKSKDVKFPITSLSLNVFFFIFKIDDTTKEFTHLICDFLFYVNYSTLFFISYFSNSIFKKELFLMIDELKSRLV